MITIHHQGQRRRTALLVPYAKNSRTHTDSQVAQIAASMREWGFTSPVIVDENGGILAGHGRVRAAVLLGMPEVPVVVASGWSEAQRRAYVIADNRIALNAGWDEDLLAAEMAELRAIGFDLDVIGFSRVELLDMLTVEGRAGATEDDATPPMPAVPSSFLGDVWCCGNHRVMCGDSLLTQALALLLDGAVVDLVLTDLPTRASHRAAGALRAWLAEVLAVAVEPLRPGGAFYLLHDEREGYAVRAACVDAGLRVRQCLVWEKPAVAADREDYRSQHAPILYGWKEGAGHLWTSDRKQTTVLEFAKPARDGEPVPGKPVALLEYLLCNSTRGEGVVLDPFGGDGETLIAAEKNGRFARVMDRDPARVDVMVARWEAFSGREATLAWTGQSSRAVRQARAAAGPKPVSGGMAE